MAGLVPLFSRYLYKYFVLRTRKIPTMQQQGGIRVDPPWLGLLGWIRNLTWGSTNRDLIDVACTIVFCIRKSEEYPFGLAEILRAREGYFVRA